MIRFFAMCIAYMRNAHKTPKPQETFLLEMKKAMFLILGLWNSEQSNETLPPACKRRTGLQEAENSKERAPFCLCPS